MSLLCPLQPGAFCGVSELQAKLADLETRLHESEARLAEAQELIRAIQFREVDAVAVSGPEGEQIFTLKDAEYAYRSLVEAMNEGAAMLANDGTVLFCNEELSRLFSMPMEQIIGRSADRLFPDSADSLHVLFEQALQGDGVKATVKLNATDGRVIPVQISLRRMAEAATLSMVVTDLSESKRWEESLRESERAFATVCNHVSQVVWMCGADGLNFYFNTRWTEYTGLTLAESYGEGWSKPFHPDDREAARSAWEQAVKSGARYEIESRLRAADGSYRWFLIRGELLKNPTGGVDRWFGTCTDIDDLKRAEEALRVNAERFRTLADNISQLCWMGNADGGISWFNQRWYEYTGTTFDQMKGWGWQSVHDPDRLPEILERWKSCIAREQDFDMVFPLRGADGVFRPFLTRIMPVRDPEGRVVQWFGTNTDISEQQNTEQALRESEERLRLFVEHAPASLAMLDRDMRHLRVSRRWLADFGMEDRNLIGLSHYDVFPEIPEHWREIHRRGLAGEVSRGEEPFHRAQRTSWLRWEVHPWRDTADEIGGIVIFSEDITERKLAEDALRLQGEQMRALATRMRTVREEERKVVARDLHDRLGQILTAIKMDLSWMTRHMPKDQDGIGDRLARSIELIGEGSLAVRRICRGLRPPVLDDLGLASAIEWEAKEFASHSGISCSVSLPDDEISLPGDASIALFRIFQECLTNVMRHSEANSVRVSMERIADDIRLTVADDGKGFAESRVSGSLGLLGMRERVQSCGGRISIESSLGAGTTVTVWIPIYPSGEN